MFPVISAVVRTNYKDGRVAVRCLPDLIQEAEGGEGRVNISKTLGQGRG